MGLRDLFLDVALLFLMHTQHTWALYHNDDVLKELVGIRRVLDAEINATDYQLELYQQKARALREAIAQIQSGHGYNKSQQSVSTTEDSTDDAAASQQRRTRLHESPQRFSDWFKPQGIFLPVNSSYLLTQLISFRPNAPLVGRRRQGIARRKTEAENDAILQFLLVLDPHSTVLSLVHPTTFKLMWKHALDLPLTSGNDAFLVADMFFVSERSAYLAVLSTTGDLALFKLRLWHNRRIVAGDPRRLDAMRDLEEKYLQCPIGQGSLNALGESQLPWLYHSRSFLTTPAIGKYLHVDIENVFAATLDRTWQYDRGKVAVVTQSYRVLVVVSDSTGGHISILHGDNGSFIKSIDTQVRPYDSNVIRLEPLQSSRGLVALVTQSQVLFMDATVPRLIPVVCEAPGIHSFTSFAVDPLRPSIVYAGTSTNRALVYKLHNFEANRQRTDLSENEAHRPAMCTLVDQLMPRQLVLSASGHEQISIVQTMPGFLVVGAGSRLVLYQLSSNTDNVRPTYLSERSFIDSFAQELNGIGHALRQHPLILGISTAKDLTVHSIGFAVLVADSNMSDQRYRVNIYESRIPPPGTNFDLGWIRVPVMMICAIAAMFWQRKGRFASHISGRDAVNEAELVTLLSAGGGHLPSMSSMKRRGVN